MRFSCDQLIQTTVAERFAKRFISYCYIKASRYSAVIKQSHVSNIFLSNKALRRWPVLFVYGKCFYHAYLFMSFSLQEFILDCYFRQIWFDKRLQFNSTDVDILSMNWLFLEKVSISP